MQEILDFLKAFIGGGKSVSAEDSSQIASYLKSVPGLQPVYQAVYDIGHADATGRHRTRERELERERDEFKTKAEKAATDLEEFKKTAPNIVEVENRFKTQITTLEDQIKGLNKQHREERETWHKKQATKDLAAALVKEGVDPEWAEYTASREENQKRIKVSTVDGEVRVEILRPNSEMPLQADEPITAFGQELRKGIKAQYITTKVKGSGSEEREGGTGGDNMYDELRKDQKKVESSTRPEGFKTGAERLNAGV